MKKKIIFFTIIIMLFCSNTISYATFKGLGEDDETEEATEEAEEDPLKDAIIKNIGIISEYLNEKLEKSRDVYSVYSLSYDLNEDDYNYYYVEYDYLDKENEEHSLKDIYQEDYAIILEEKNTDELSCYSYVHDENKYLDIVEALNYDNFIDYDVEKLEPDYEAGGEEKIKTLLAEFANMYKERLNVKNPDSFRVEEAICKYDGNNYSGSVNLLITMSAEADTGQRVYGTYIMRVNDYEFTDLYGEEGGYVDQIIGSSMSYETSFDVNEIMEILDDL